MYRSGDRARWLTSGEIEYLGRGDEQVKYHGYRIELSEISSAFNQHPQVRNSVVLLRQDHRGEDTLVAYYVARREIETAVLREFLLDHLIKETIPNVFIHLTRLPLTLNGKVDYRALPELQETHQRQGEYVAPRTVVEEVVAGIWANLLGLERVSSEDNFFELGGHSLIATQVMVRVQKTTGVELPLRMLFESPTVATIGGANRSGTGKGYFDERDFRTYRYALAGTTRQAFGGDESPAKGRGLIVAAACPCRARRRVAALVCAAASLVSGSVGAGQGHLQLSRRGAVYRRAQPRCAGPKFQRSGATA